MSKNEKKQKQAEQIKLFSKSLRLMNWEVNMLKDKRSKSETGHGPEGLAGGVVEITNVSRFASMLDLQSLLAMEVKSPPPKAKIHFDLLPWGLAWSHRRD